MKKVLIALDYSDVIAQVAEKASGLAKALGAEVALVHVLSDVTYYSSLNYSPILGFDSFSNLDILQTNIIDDVRLAAKDFLNRVKEEFQLYNAETIVREGDFADEILKAAKELNADIIAVGTHSRKGIDKILIGSVAQKVLSKSTIPVFIIPVNRR